MGVPLFFLPPRRLFRMLKNRTENDHNRTKARKPTFLLHYDLTKNRIHFHCWPFSLTRGPPHPPPYIREYRRRRREQKCASFFACALVCAHTPLTYQHPHRLSGSPQPRSPPQRRSFCRTRLRVSSFVLLFFFFLSLQLHQHPRTHICLLLHGYLPASLLCSFTDTVLLLLEHKILMWNLTHTLHNTTDAHEEAPAAASHHQPPHIFYHIPLLPP